MYDDLYVTWTGTANFKDALYRVTVQAPASAWKKDVQNVIHAAGGHAYNLECTSDLRVTFLPDNIKTVVTFTPDPNLTENAHRRREVTINLDSHGKKVPQGDSLPRAGAFRGPSPSSFSNPIYCPKCGAPGYRGTLCHNCGIKIQCRS